MQDTICEKCSARIQIWKKADAIRCKECGSVYDLEDSNIEDQYIDYAFKFTEFRCINASALDVCDNVCPAPGMYCEYHVSDDSLATARNSIIYAEQRLNITKETLERMEESKKTWLIQKVSGIDE